ncbi:MAG: hypothetical protein M3Y21_05460 [Candidatus Eremiobacteraeota bacterium]|nr:hypothetical protein [Candidatus Eremiobacteraeota bacterium]
MMNRVRLLAATGAAFLVVSACNGGGTQPAQVRITNISGDYTGTVQDSTSDALTASAILAQHSNAAGGTLSLAAGAKTLVTGISLIIAANNAVSGTIVEDLPTGVTCTMSTTGNYNSANSQITGSHTAVTGCSGETGTYVLNQQCSDTVTNVLRRRPMGVTSC